MAQYQTFPGAPGDSLTLDKLKRLALPDLQGKSFLDVGCNEGFFCGFARSMGARRAVGIDQVDAFIERAKRRFPECEFHAQGWDRIPDDRFDVILLASALHYAEDQEGLLHTLVEHLAPDGVLVLELGIVTSKQSEWVGVHRGIDERLFPTMPKLREILEPYAWKWMGPSIPQAGDPVARHVLHISPRRHAAYLLMQPPAYGKTSIARSLFPAAGLPVVSGDLVIGRIAAGELEAPPRLSEAVVEGYSPFQIDVAIRRILERGCGPDLVKIWLEQAGSGDFSLDMYVPQEFQAGIKSALVDAGYLPVTLDWERPGGRLLSAAELRQGAEEFYLSMVEGAPTEPATPVDWQGFVDEAKLCGGVLKLRGWAVDSAGRVPASLRVSLGETLHEAAFERQLRPDVQTHLGLPHALVGYQASVPAPGLQRLSQLAGQVEVTVDGGIVLPFAASLAGILGRRKRA